MKKDRALDELYKLARNCAEFNNKGCNCQCERCGYNIYLYTNERDATLIKSNAYADYQRYKEVVDRIEQRVRQNNTAATVGPLIVIALFVGGFVWCCSACKSCSNPSQTISVSQLDDNKIEQRYVPLTIDDEVKWLLNNQNNPENIPHILKVIKQQNVLDLNRDGKINCIDYSITFRNLYGYNAKLIINRNYITGMNHMFVIVQYPDSINTIHVEPQGDPDWYTMGQVWGVKYDQYRNHDVTDVWGQYIGGM